ncbi:MAG: LysE family translocator [Syntrophales bacterium]|nr:LysE family translocator [Syntrophales bacterium]
MFVLATVFFTSFIVALSGALMPGPLLMVTVSESPRRGFLTGPLLIIGHSILEGMLVVAVVLGLLPYLRKFGVFEVIAVLGAVMLIFMTWEMIKELPSLTLNGPVMEKETRSLMLTGVMVSLANPYWSLWWLTVGLGYIVWSMSFGVPGVVLFFLGHIFADFLWYSGISFALARGKSFFSDRFYRVLVGICAFCLGCFALFFLYTGLSRIYRYFFVVT